MAAGVLLPVAVTAEVLAVPGVGWLALYQVGPEKLALYQEHELNSRDAIPSLMRVTFGITIE